MQKVRRMRDNKMKIRYNARFCIKLILVIGVAVVVIGYLLLEFVLKKEKLEMFHGTHSSSTQDVAQNQEVQNLVDYLSNKLDVRYKVISNMIHGDSVLGMFRSELTLQNGGSSTITTRGSWALFLQHPSMFSKDDIHLDKFGIKWSHINGDLYRLEPTDSFKDLPPGGSITLPLVAFRWLIARSDMLPNWYIVAPDAQPRILKCTAGESLKFIANFDQPAKWKRVPTDTYHPFSVAERYKHNFVPWQKLAPIVVPSPLHFNVSRAKLSINKDSWVIVADKQTMEEARILSDATGIPVTKESRQSKCIVLTVGTVDVPGVSGPRRQEAYSLQVDQKKEVVLLKGESKTGVFYGIQSLLSLGDDTLTHLPVAHITDAPRYEYRGLMMDVSRNFFPKKDILDLLDTMAMYKLNRLHLHLTDDQGWRLEIPGLPELTQIGSKRSHDLKETSSLMVTLGSGPFTNSSGSGYYTVDDYKEILKYAKARHIKVIPEIDMPGHSHAAIMSMEGRHRSHGDDEYTLIDHHDNSTYLSVQQFHMNSLNPCLESTYHFIEHIVRALVDMHKDISPLETFHFGGDEVPSNANLQSPACKKLGINDTAGLEGMFLKRISQIAHKHSLQLQGWGDIFFVSETGPLAPSTLETKEIYSHAWMSRHPTLQRSHQLANAGYKVILSLASHLYLDHPQEPDPEERGLYWATRYIDTQKVFKYRPDNVYDNIDEERFGKPITKDKACSSTVNCVPLKKPENIIGMQSQLWTETIRNRSQLDEMLYPRLIAFAERAWHRASWEQSAKMPYFNDWVTFANCLGQKELGRLERRGIRYYLPPPGANIDTKNQSMDVNVAFPGLKIQYSSNGGKSWLDVGEQSVLNGDILLASRFLSHQFFVIFL
ncbi:N,N'-diacetylchitobiase [Lamellibrachia satsuma]|nr:N,N'-diacetylchitobiase [Lamellibrachia satsuma]